MKQKYNKEEIILIVILTITGIISFVIAQKIGIRTRFVFTIFVAIEVALYCFVKTSQTKKVEEKPQVIAVKPEVYHNSMQEMYDKMCDYCKQLTDANYDTYKTNFSPKTLEEIQAWEEENQVTLPKGYKDWLMLSNGTDEIQGTHLLALEQICRCPFPEYEDYYILGSYIGDGSNVVTDKKGVFYELDHVDGLTEVAFETFVDRWILETLENCMAEAGIL